MTSLQLHFPSYFIRLYIQLLLKIPICIFYFLFQFLCLAYFFLLYILMFSFPNLAHTQYILRLFSPAFPFYWQMYHQISVSYFLPFSSSFVHTSQYYRYSSPFFPITLCPLSHASLKFPLDFVFRLLN